MRRSRQPVELRAEPPEPPAAEQQQQQPPTGTTRRASVGGVGQALRWPGATGAGMQKPAGRELAGRERPGGGVQTPRTFPY